MSPGPGLVPLLLGIILAPLGIAISVLALFYGVSEGKAFWLEKDRGYKIVSTVVAMLIYGLLVNHLGFVAITFLLMFFLFKVIFNLNWKISLGVAIVISASAYLLFNVWLGVQLPAGPFGV